MGTGQMSTTAGVMSKWRSPRQPWRSNCSLGANWLVVLQVVICLRDCVLAIDTLGNGDLILIPNCTTTDHPGLGEHELGNSKSK
jgi:hypothetical protein